MEQTWQDSLSVILHKDTISPVFEESHAVNIKTPDLISGSIGINFNNIKDNCPKVHVPCALLDDFFYLILFYD